MLRRCALISAVLALILSGIACIASAAWRGSLAQGKESPADEVAKRLAWELDTRKSVELRTRVDIIPGKVDPQKPLDYDAIEEHYIETGVGQRKCDSRGLKSERVVSHYARFSDGSKCADLNYSKDDLERETSFVIKRHYGIEDRSDRMDCPEPLRALHVGREPLQKALCKADYLGEKQVLGRDCDVFLFTRVRWEIPQDHVYYIDKKSSIPLKVESYLDQSARERNKLSWVWVAESLDQVQEHFVALNSKTVAYDEDSGPPFTWIHRVLSIEFGKEFPPSTFWPTLQPGVTVLDTISNKRYQVPGTSADSAPAKAKVGEPNEPVVAAPPSGWTTPASNVLLGLGAAVLIAACVLWRRSR